MKTSLGIELGSTRIKAVTMDEAYRPIASGEYIWKSHCIDGIWSYDLDQMWQSLRAALADMGGCGEVVVAGVSAMMHGYLAFDRDWNLLTPFRTWQNTTTGRAAAELTKLFGFNIPQRWSIAHLYQAVLDGEPHVEQIAHITTLAGYVHYMLTGVNALGVGDASGMFPVDSGSMDYNEKMVEQFDHLIASQGYSWKLREILPWVLPAGEQAGELTLEGAARLGGLLQPGIPLAPPEGDAGTGMVATNAVAPRTGNISAGTSIFSMIVLEHPLRQVYPEIDMVTTPAGAPVAMVHCNNCTGDLNAWTEVLRETICLFGGNVDANELYTKLFRLSLTGDADCGGVMAINYLAGEGVTHFDEGRPLVLRVPGSRFTLANFLRAQLYGALATLRIGMEILEREDVAIDSLTGHGGLFKTPVVGQSYLAAACGVPVTCRETAGEGGPYGMALLADYMLRRREGESLERYLHDHVFRNAVSSTLNPSKQDMAGFAAYMRRYRRALEVERAALEMK